MNISNFLFGMAHAFDIGATLSDPPDFERDDGEAIAKDWKAIGDDMAEAIGRQGGDVK